MKTKPNVLGVLALWGLLAAVQGCTDSGNIIPGVIFPGISADGTTIRTTVTPLVYEVRIRDFGFDPVTIYASPGSTVRWLNSEVPGDDHAITFFVPGIIVGEGTPRSMTVDSGILKPGGKFDYTFTEPGTYEYSCRLHPASPPGTVVIQ